MPGEFFVPGCVFFNMTCCCPHSRSASKCFSLFARCYRWRFQWRGFEPAQKQLLEGLSQAGFEGKTLLEVGSGVGHLHQTLLERGAKSAVGIDLAQAMIEQARDWAAKRGLSDRTHYISGDFMEESEAIQPAQVTILDKVVCCYPDADGLVHRSLDKTTEVFALTFPRNTWYTRMGVTISALLMRLLGSAFRPYVHDPRQIEQWITQAGFTRCYENNTFVWLTQVYHKT